jgi:hypothetical protein
MRLLRRSIAHGAASLCVTALSPALAETLTLRATRPGQPPVTLRASSVDNAWTIRVLDARNREVQRIEVESDALDSRPGLRDADGDGAQDLWLPTMSGNANTEYEIWRMIAAQGRFVRSGTVSGIEFRRDGVYVVAVGRNGCCAVGHDFYRFAPDGRMAHAFTIDLRYAEEGRVESCEATAQADQPVDAVRERWCQLAPQGRMPGRRL